MVFEITSKYDVDDVVVLNNNQTATVLNVELQLFDNYYKIRYLLEFSNQERKWTDENSIAKKRTEDGTI